MSLRAIAVRFLAPRPHIEPVPGWRLGDGDWDRIFVRRLRRFVWRQLDSPTVMPWSHGLKVHLYPGDEISRAIFLTGMFEPSQLAFLVRTVKLGMTFIDVGANFGLYTLLASRLVGANGRVISLEPSSRELGHLSENVALNRLANVSLVNRAVTDKAGEAELILAMTGKSGHNTLGAFGYPSVDSVGTERVKTTTLDVLSQEMQLSSVDFIKMDIEGAELFALRGGVELMRKFRPAILLELSDRTLAGQNASSEQVLQFFRENDYLVFDFDDRTGGIVEARGLTKRDGDNVVAIHRKSVDRFQKLIRH